VRKVDVFRVRVDDAAKDLDTMGPAVASITGNGADWTVSQTSDVYGTNIDSVSGFDTPSGSWKQVWYRAVAWSDPDPLRGYLAGRSPASSAATLVVPPSDPPNLSAITQSWPLGGALGDVLLTWTSTAPVRKTPLGPHTLTVYAAAAGVPPLAGNDPLRVRRVASPGEQQDYYAFCRVTVARFVVRLTAPDSRFIEQTIPVS
jgi:hypothetical protein